MLTTNLRKVGGSVMLTVPPAILDMLKLQAGATVGLAVDDGRLVVDPTVKLRYKLEELLARYDADSPIADSEEGAEWLNVAPVGREL